MQIKILGNIYGFTGGSYAGNVIGKYGICPALNAMRGGNRQPLIVAMRGRNPNNPNDRKQRGIHLEQRLEMRQDGLSNTLTSVEKDNYVLVKEATKAGCAACKIGGGGRYRISHKPNS